MLLAGFVALGVLAAIILPRKYTAVASLVIDAKPDPVSAANVSDSVMASYVNTQIDVITSERVAYKVVKMLKLDTDPDMVQMWRDKTEGKGDVTDFIANYLLLYKRIQAAPPTSASTTRQTNVIEVTVVWGDPEMAAKLANAFAQTTIDTNIELRVQPAKQYSAYFDQRSAALRADLERKQQALSNFQAASGIVATDEKLDQENTRLAELSTQLTQIQSMRSDSNARTRQTGDNAHLPEVLQSPLINNLKDALTRAEAARTEAAGRLGKNHPDYQAAEAEVNSLRARIATETEKIVASLGSTAQVNVRRESDVREALEAQKKKVLDMKHEHDRAAILQSDVTSAQRDLDAVTQRLALSNLESLTQQTNVVMLTTATVPTQPSSPKVLILLAVGVFLGLIAGGGTALLMETRDKRLRREEELIEILNVPILARLKAAKLPVAAPQSAG